MDISQIAAVKEFKTAHHHDLFVFLQSSAGRALLEVLPLLRPQPHLSASEEAGYRLGAIAGYEQAVANLRVLAVSPKEKHDAPSIRYGVPEPNQQPKA